MIHRERGLGVTLLAPARTPLFPSAKEAVMKVIMRTSASHDGKRYDSGRRVDVPDDTAKLWVGLGIAEATNSAKATKKAATRTAPRTAAKQEGGSTSQSAQAKDASTNRAATKRGAKKAATSRTRRTSDK